MAERWISQSEKLLKAMEELSFKKKHDRLETVNSMILALDTLGRSVHGWRSWIQSPPLMSKFTEEELREMEEGLSKRVHAFVEYDIKMTTKHKGKIPKIIVAIRGRKKKEEVRGLYV